MRRLNPRLKHGLHVMACVLLALEPTLCQTRHLRRRQVHLLSHRALTDASLRTKSVLEVQDARCGVLVAAICT